MINYCNEFQLFNLIYRYINYALIWEIRWVYIKNVNCALLVTCLLYQVDLVTDLIIKNVSTASHIWFIPLNPICAYQLSNLTIFAAIRKCAYTIYFCLFWKRAEHYTDFENKRSFIKISKKQQYRNIMNVLLTTKIFSTGLLHCPTHNNTSWYIFTLYQLKY